MKLGTRVKLNNNFDDSECVGAKGTIIYNGGDVYKVRMRDKKLGELVILTKELDVMVGQEKECYTCLHCENDNTEDYYTTDEETLCEVCFDTYCSETVRLGKLADYPHWKPRVGIAGTPRTSYLIDTMHDLSERVHDAEKSGNTNLFKNDCKTCKRQIKGVNQLGHHSY